MVPENHHNHTIFTVQFLFKIDCKTTIFRFFGPLQMQRNLWILQKIAHFPSMISEVKLFGSSHFDATIFVCLSQYNILIRESNFWEDLRIIIKQLFLASYYKQLSAFIECTIIRLKLVFQPRDVHLYIRRKLDIIQCQTYFFRMAENRL